VFGSDSAVRRDLVPVALDRARRRLNGSVLELHQVVVIGDTERDVDCGRHLVTRPDSGNGARGMQRRRAVGTSHGVSRPNVSRDGGFKSGTQRALSQII
jgi:hypothetical protein